MSNAMIRKQVYLARAQDRKLKAIAARRGCTEAEVIRNALDQLPDPEGSVVEQLAAAGLLAPKPTDLSIPSGDEALTLERKVEAWLAARTRPLGLSEAVLADRDGR